MVCSCVMILSFLLYIILCYWFVLYFYMFIFGFFFFFQAEDGIRDLTVTGVQTCALPISDGNGRDLFVRSLYGGQVSLMVGFTATMVSLVIGVIWGATAGFLGGRVDGVMMRIVDILYSLPFIFFVIMLAVVFGPRITLIYIAIGAVSWLDMARIVRGQTISIRRREFIEAAEASGVSRWRIITRHIIPNCLGPVVVYVTLTVPNVILIESFISFLGMGVQEPASSSGTLVSESAVVMEIAPWAVVGTGGMLAVTLLCLNFIGDGMRDAFDPKDR